MNRTNSIRKYQQSSPHPSSTEANNFASLGKRRHNCWSKGKQMYLHPNESVPRTTTMISEIYIHIYIYMSASKVGFSGMILENEDIKSKEFPYIGLLLSVAMQSLGRTVRYHPSGKKKKSPLCGQWAEISWRLGIFLFRAILLSIV